MKVYVYVYKIDSGVVVARDVRHAVDLLDFEEVKHIRLAEVSQDACHLAIFYGTESPRWTQLEGTGQLEFFNAWERI